MHLYYLEKLIRDHNVTSDQIAQEAGVNADQIEKIRNGVIYPEVLPEDTINKLHDYSLKLYHPKMIFWDPDDHDYLMELLENNPANHWELSIFNRSSYNDRNVIAHERYPIDLKIRPFDLRSKELINKYYSKYQEKSSGSDKYYFQPLYVEDDELSYFNKNDERDVLKSLIMVLNKNHIAYADKIEGEDELSRRTLVVDPPYDGEEGVFSLTFKDLTFPLSPGHLN
ncbi:hypothetical protein [Lentilactobacillus otakiensis]|uniref:hypothetical protein n=1 Tax=Lentilactobacillus otakiensis TaxID=481720 RepID=UPI003D16AB8C